MKTHGQSWDEILRALERLDSVPESTAEMDDAVCDANGIIGKCTDYSIRPEDVEIVRFNPSSYAFPHAKAVLELAARGSGVTVGVRHYGKGTYIWYLRLAYSERRLRGCLQALPVSVPPTGGRRARQGSLDDVVRLCKSFEHPARETSIYFDPAKRYVRVDSAYGGGDYRGSDGYHIRKTSTDTFACIAVSSTA